MSVGALAAAGTPLVESRMAFDGRTTPDDPSHGARLLRTAAAAARAGAWFGAQQAGLEPEMVTALHALALGLRDRWRARRAPRG